MAITYDQWKQQYQGKINPATNSVWQYGDVAQATGMNPADVERFGLGAQQSAWNQNVAGGGAYVGQPLWKDPYAGGSAYLPVNHTLNGAAGSTNLTAGYVNPQQWQAQQTPTVPIMQGIQTTTPTVQNEGAAPGRPKPTPVGESMMNAQFPPSPWTPPLPENPNWGDGGSYGGVNDPSTGMPWWAGGNNPFEGFGPNYDPTSWTPAQWLEYFANMRGWGGGNNPPPPSNNPNPTPTPTVPGGSSMNRTPAYNPGVTNPRPNATGNSSINRTTTGGIVSGPGAPSISGTSRGDILTSMGRAAIRSTPSVIGALTQNPTPEYPKLTGDLKTQAEQYLKNYANTANAGLNDIGYNPQAGYADWYGKLLGQNPTLQSGPQILGQLTSQNEATGGLADYFASGAKTGGLTPEYVSAMKSLVYDPMQEQLLTSLNQMGGGQAQLNSPLFAELQRRGVEQFNNQLIQQGMQNVGTYGSLANQLYGTQQQGTGLLSNVMNNAQKNLLDYFQTQNQWNLGSQQTQAQLAQTLISGLFNDMASQRQMDAQSKAMWGQILGFTINSIDDVLGALGNLGII